MRKHGFDTGLDCQSAVSAVAEYILNAIRSADEIRETKMFYEIPCEFGSIMYPRNGGYVQFYLDGERLSSKSFDEFIKSVMMYYWLCKVKFEPNKYPEYKDKLISEIQKKLEDRPFPIIITSKHDFEFYLRKFEQDPKNYVMISARGIGNIIKAKLLTEFLKTHGFVEVKRHEKPVIINGVIVPQYQIILKRKDNHVKILKGSDNTSKGNSDICHLNTHIVKSSTEPAALDPFRCWGEYDPKKIRQKLNGTYE